MLLISHTEAHYLFSYFVIIWLPVFWFCAGYTSRKNFNLLSKSKLIGEYGWLTLFCLLFTLLYFREPVSFTDIWGALYGRNRVYAAPVSVTNPWLLGMNNGPLWFLPSLFTSYIVFKGILLAKTFRWQCALCLCSLLVATFLDRMPVLLPWSMDSAFVFAVIMCFGNWFRRYELFERGGLCLLIASAIVFSCLAPFVGPPNPSLRMFGNYWPAYVVAATAGVIAVLIICRWFENSVIGRIGIVVNSEALCIFGLQFIGIKLYYEWLGYLFTDWKIRILVCVIFCFAFGWLIGRIAKLIKQYLKLKALK